MSIRGAIFENQHPFASDHALAWQACMSDGLLYGCAMSFTDSLFSISEGFMIVGGRVFELTANENISVSPGTGFARIIVTIDTSATSTETEFEQVAFSVDYAANADSFAELTQGPINTNQGPAIYQAAVAVLNINSTGIAGIETQMEIVTPGGTISKKIPEFTYEGGTFKLIDDGDNNWRIKFLTSGTLKFTKLNSAKAGIEVFLVGGGGAGKSTSGSSGYYNGGGGGGYTYTTIVTSLEENTEYSIVIGAGGTSAVNGTATNGGTSSAFGFNAAGGYAGARESGGNGGSGGGYQRAGGSYGNDAGGKGQISAPGPNGETGNTYEFGDESLDPYAGGGGGSNGNGSSPLAGGAGGGGAGGFYNNVESNSVGKNGTANTGGGGGGARLGAYKGGNGGSGIVIIRNRRV